MADVAKLNLDGTSYDIRDTAARNANAVTSQSLSVLTARVDNLENGSAADNAQSISHNTVVNSIDYLNNSGAIFELGGYSDTDGITKTTRNDRIRSANLIDLKDIESISTPSGYTVWTYCFDKDLNYIGGHYGWRTKNTLKCTFRPDIRFINLVFKSTSSDTADLTNNVTALQNAVKIIKREDAVNGINNIVVSGTFSDSDGGTPVANNKRARTEIPLRIEYINRFEIPDGYLVWVYFLDSSYGLIWTSGWLTHAMFDSELKTYLAGDCLGGTRLFNIVFKKSDDSVITTNEIEYLCSASKIHLFDDSALEEKFNEYERILKPYQYGKRNSAWSKRINILHTSDLHLGFYGCTRRLIQLVDLCNYLSNIDNTLNPLDLFLHTGDLSNGGVGNNSSTTILRHFTDFTSTIESLKVPAIGLLGNHDENVNGTSTSVSTSYITRAKRWENYYSAFTASTINWGNEGVAGYHYYDVTKNGQSIRFICLDQLDHADPTGSIVYDVMGQAVYSQAQINWLCGVALRVPDNYGVVICNHFPFAPRLSGYSHSYAALNDGIFVQGWRLIPDIVRAWVNRTSLNATYTDTVSSNNITVNANFSTIGSGAVFICYLAGHTHSKDAFIVQDENHNSYKQLMLVEDSNGQQGFALNETYKDSQSTASNCAASVISFDLNLKRVYRISYGTYQNTSTASKTNPVECYTFDPTQMGETAKSIDREIGGSSTTFGYDSANQNIYFTNE